MSAPKAEQDRANAIKRELVRFWKAGIRLSEDDLSFMESGFGITGPEDLEEILSRKDDPDRETLMERVLFPEVSLRLALEPLTGCLGVGADLERSIAQKLSAACPVISLKYPGKSLHAEVSFLQIKGFVSRLYLSRSLPERVCRTLDHGRPEAEALSCRVILRCKNMNMTPEKETLLVRFIRESSGGYPEFEKLFRLCADLLSDAPASKDPGIYLQERRRQEKNLLRQIQRFEEERDRWGMEYLMMSRFQVPSESLETVTARLDLMETMILGILCLPPLPREMVRHRDLGSFGPDGRLSDLMARLS